MVYLSPNCSYCTLVIFGMVKMEILIMTDMQFLLDHDHIYPLSVKGKYELEALSIAQANPFVVFW